MVLSKRKFLVASALFFSFLFLVSSVSANSLPQISRIFTEWQVTAGNPETAVGMFSDLDSGDTHTASWNWGDGNVTVGTVSPGMVVDSHVYTTTGTYTLTLTVTDSAGGVAQKSRLVVVQ